MRQRDRQSGFSATVVLLAILVVAVLAVAGFAVFQHNRTKVSNAAANTNPSTNQQTTTQQPTNTQPTSTVTYLHIKEWGVKLPLSDSIKDAYYTTAGSNTGSDGLPNTAWIGLTSLNSTGCDISATGPSATATPIGSIIRVLPTDHDPVKGTLYTQLYPNGVTINGYYYAYKPWVNKTCAPQTTLQSIDTAFATASKATVSDTAATN